MATEAELEQLKKNVDSTRLVYNILHDSLVPTDATEKAKYEKDLDTAWNNVLAARNSYNQAVGTTTQNATTGPTPIVRNIVSDDNTGVMPAVLPPLTFNPIAAGHLLTMDTATSAPSMQMMTSVTNDAFSAISGLTGGLLSSATSALATLSPFSGAPQLVDQMKSHVDFISNNQVRVYNAINQKIDPTNTNNPNKCSNLGDFIGFMQGGFNSILSTISNGLTNIIGALGNITSSILGGFTNAISSLTNAIATGVNSLIQTAIGGLHLATGLITTALGPVGKLLNGLTSDIGSLASGIANEAANIISAIGSQFSGPFLSGISNSNICMRLAQTTETATKPLLVGSDGIVIGPV